MEGVVTYESDIVKLTTDNHSYKKSMIENQLIYKDLV